MAVKQQRASQALCYAAELVGEAWAIKNAVRNKFSVAIDKINDMQSSCLSLLFTLV